ncbi:OLC1v1028574C1 [Oldenlandia corymbosa var. corymbosa]|uniref:OLC1v1028574C1 n=1 Tax=Oldenlandia corymbosa var. corymbosa TaxID=529605 RepID=A0AAV1CCB0_OLDCO|nr:OLC1v1028574C1 [Oldenlandia corymbosa var. corymbosa]
MDSIQAQKLEAMKSYKRAQLVYNLIVYSLTAFLSCLFYLYLFWFPSLSMNQLLSVLLPNIYALISPNKLLFVLGNLIVLFLIVSSGSHHSSSASSPADEIYNEYVRRSRSMNKEMHKKNNGIIHRKKSVKMDHYHAAARVDSIKKVTLEKKEKEIEVDNKHIGGEVEVVHDHIVGENHDHDEVVTNEVEKLISGRVPEEIRQDALAVVVRDEDQLKRRVEDFIARVNRQRMLEESRSR